PIRAPMAALRPACAPCWESRHECTLAHVAGACAGRCAGRGDRAPGRGAAPADPRCRSARGNEIRARARDKARRQLRRAVAELRAIERERMQQVRAELETAARRQSSARALGALAAAWPKLGAALADRWDDADARKLWVDAQLSLRS